MFRGMERPAAMTKKHLLSMLTASVLLLGACSSSGGDATDSTDPVASDDAGQPDTGSDDDGAGGEQVGAGTSTITLNGEVMEMVVETCNNYAEGSADVDAKSADGEWTFFMIGSTIGIGSDEAQKAYRTNADNPLAFEVAGGRLTSEGSLPPYAGAQGDPATISIDLAC